MERSKRKDEAAAGDTAIAIVGIGCRFPSADGPDAFWELLREGGDGVAEIPPERWDVDAFYDPDPASPGKMITRWGGFLENIKRFDAAFFGLSPREANHVDPQQRVILETAWEALEDAGIPPYDLRRSQTGVFIATIAGDWATDLFTKYSACIDAYSGTGTTSSLIANRVSYFLDLRGPSITIDSACSGSLTAIHLASKSLRRRECTLALAGGVNLLLRPDGNLFFTKAGALSPDGRCKPFDERANGIVRSEGAGVLVLKRLDDAVAAGDDIYATVVGTAINQDGRSSGVMAPNTEAQQALLREALADAGLAPQAVQYIEAHGTGTSVGDPIEANSLGRVLGDRDGVCALGSVKSNIGHTESAAGVAGTIKVALAMRHRKLPPTVHFQKPNPTIPFDELRLRVQDRLGPWPDPDKPLVAGVNGFGIGGANAHVLLREAPPVKAASSEPVTGGGAWPLLLSARSEDALRELAAAYASRSDDAEDWQTVCRAAATSRSHLEKRAAVVARSREEAAEKLAALGRGEESARVVRPEGGGKRFRRLVWAFSGQGTHWPGMGVRLLAREAVFRATVERCDAALGGLADWSLVEELERPAGEDRFGETCVAQTAIYAVQAALADLLRSWGGAPDLVVGQSLGEVAAAYAAGALSLEDGLAVAFHRGRLMQRLQGRGATAFVGLPVDQVELALAGFAGDLDVAGVTGPLATVVSGVPQAVDRLLEALSGRGVMARRLEGVDIAFHSSQMDGLVPELVASLAVSPRPVAVPLISSVTGGEVEGGELDGDYWGRNLRQPFALWRALERVADEDPTDVLEISPHAVLAGSIRQAWATLERETRVLTTLARDGDDEEQMMTVAGRLYAAGYDLDWPRVIPPSGRRAKLPHYPWQRQRHWYEELQDASGVPVAGAPAAADAGDGHLLLGSSVPVAHPPGHRVWQRELYSQSLFWLDEHRVQGAVILPATAHLEMACAAVGGEPEAGGVMLSGVSFRKPLVLQASSAQRTQLVLGGEPEGPWTFRLFSQPSGADSPAWVRHTEGTATRLDQAPRAAPDLEAVRAGCGDTMSKAAFYERLLNNGIEYGDSFQAVETISFSSDEAVAELRLSAAAAPQAGAFLAHPAILDAAFQTMLMVFPRDDDTFVPVNIREYRAYGPVGSEVRCHTRAVRFTPDERWADLTLVDGSGRVVAEVLGLHLRKLLAASRTTLGYEVAWRSRALASADLVAADSAQQGWLIFADSAGLADELGRAIEERGEWCVTVRPGDEYGYGDGAATIDPDEPEHYERLAGEIFTAGRPAYRAVVHLWSLDAAEPGDGARRSAKSVLHLLRAFAAANVEGMARRAAEGAWSEPPRIFVATRGAQVAEGSEPVAPAQAAVWGLGRVAANEHPELWGGLIDLDPASEHAEDARALVSECVATEAREPGVAYRAGERRVARLERSSGAGAEAAAARLRDDASYLITGGLGALGLEVAGWLADRGARRLFLAGRRGLPPRAEWRGMAPDSGVAEQIAAVRALESRGVSVHPVALDVGDRRQVTAFFARLAQEGWPALRGVVHAAGVLRDGLISRMSGEAFDATWRPKVDGAWNLHRATRGLELDFFVLFSSVSSVVGSLGQGNYAAANAFMDALAWARARQGLPAVSINWGPWAEVGMAARMDDDAGRAHAAFGALRTDEALDLLGQRLVSTAPQVLAVQADWQVWAAKAGAGAARLVEGLIEVPDSAESSAEEEVLAAEFFDAATNAVDPAAVGHWLRELAAKVLRSDAATLETDQPLSLMGFDSILIAEVQTQIRSSLGVEIPLNHLLMGASVDSVAEHVVAALRSRHESAVA